MYKTRTTFLDTNILLYSVDDKDLRKSQIAEALIQNLWKADDGVLSWQVLNEFYWNATRKLKIADNFARSYVEQMSEWHVIPPSIELTRRAWHWSDQTQLTYWDGLIVAAAERGRCSILLTEDLQAGRKFGDGLTVVNPFAEL